MIGINENALETNIAMVKNLNELIKFLVQVKYREIKIA
jgi:hypothetical protein